MPAIIINNEGHYLYYEDTGPPSSNRFTTLIIVHGTAFHARIFKRILPLAPQHNLRLVVVNRRDYPGSSPYTEDDLDKIRGDPKSQCHDEFAKDRALEFAEFIKAFVERENVPKASSDWKSGGMILMSWSSGNGYTLPLLSYIDSIPECTRTFIEPYLRSLIVFDTPRAILGVPPINPGIDIIKNSSLSEEEQIRRFGERVGAYYTHKSLTSRNVADLQVVPAEDSRRSTIQSMTTEDLKEVIEYTAVKRSEVFAQSVSPATCAERLRRAVFDDELGRYWPRCGVDVVWCEHSTWESIDVMWGFQRARQKADEDGIVGRPLRIVMMPGVNHFPHWDEPTKTIEFLSKLVDSHSQE